MGVTSKMTSLLKLEWLLIGVGIGISLGEEDLFIFLFGMSILMIGFGLEFYNEHKRHKEMFNELNPKGLYTRRSLKK